MRLIKLLMLVVASGIITFGTAQYLFSNPYLDPFVALLYQGISGIVCGAVGMMKICEDYDEEALKMMKNSCAVWRK
jgi:hypothetical protein